MVAPTWRGGSLEVAYGSLGVDWGAPPLAGDLIVMILPVCEPAPSGWTVANGQGGRVCWRVATGAETAFPFPAEWFSGVEGVEPVDPRG